MSTINGVGTGFNGFSEFDPEGNFTATKWFTIFYFPIFPLWKGTLKRQVTECTVFQYQLLGYEKMNAREVLSTYLYGWILTPLMLLWPLVLCVKEIAGAIGIPTEGNRSWIYMAFMIFGILYLVVAVWKWKDWMEERGLPANYKEQLKQMRNDRNRAAG